MVKASGQYVVQHNRVISVCEGAAPATPTGTGKKGRIMAKKTEEASTPDTKEEDELATPEAEEVELKVEAPVTPKSARASIANGDKDEKATPSTTLKHSTSSALKKRTRAKKDTKAEGGDDLEQVAKKARKMEKEKAAERVEGSADEFQADSVAKEIVAKECRDDA